MARQSIFIGTAANDGTGDTLRNAMIKVNDNFTELYSVHTDTSSSNYNIPYGDVGPVSAISGAQFTHNSLPVEFTITVSSEFYQQVQVRLSAPSILLTGSTQGPVVFQRVVEGVSTDVYGFIVSSIDNGYHITYEDTHGQPIGTQITYRLVNKTNLAVAGTVSFVTTYGFQFGGREI